MIMYGTRYVLQFDSEKFGHEYKILIKEDGYSGSPEKKSLGTAPLLRKDDSDSGISGTSLEMVIQADEDGELASLYTVDNKKFLVELYKNSSLIWTGYVLPEKYSEPYVPVPYDVSVTASDGLGILKDIPFTLSGEKTLFEVIRFCCNQTGITLDFIVFSSLAESSMNTSNSMLVQTSFDVSTFRDITCYEVLESLLTSLDAFITEANGKWMIARYTDLDKEGFLYSNAGELRGRVSLESRVLGNVHSGLYPIGNLELEIEPANKSVKFTSDYDLRPSFLQNYDFSGGDSGWGGFEYVIAERKGVWFAAMHGNSGKQERYIQQGVSVEKSSQAVILEVKFALAQMFASMNGRAGEDREFALKMQLSGEGQTYYLSDEGWGTKDYRFPVHGSLQDMFWDRDLSTNYVDDYEGNFKITADGFPVSGQLTISIYNIYVEMSGTSKVRSSLFLDQVVVTNDCSGGIDVSVNLAEKASTSHEDVDIRLTDVPFEENADKMFYNGLKVAGKYTSAWSCGGETDSFLYTILKSVCSRIGFPRKQLSGIIQGENLDSLMLLVDKYSGSLFYPREFSLNLLTDEQNVTLDQFMPYHELSGESTESPRVPGNNTSEYRSSGENEIRVYQGGVGIPMRIKDLSPSELKPDSVIEVDRTNVAKSGKATLQKLLEFILTTGKVWTEERLKVVEGYILYLGEKIKSGDSDLWEGNAFNDYLNQAVKSDSNVKFRSVTSDSFLSDNFSLGALGSGFGLFKKDSTGKSYLEIDKIFVRLKAIFAALEVRKLTYVGGNYVFSPAGMTCTEVEEFDGYYRVYFTADNGEKAVENLFRVDDLVQARESNIKPGVHVNVSNRYYWRRCIATGDDYVDLSKTDCDVDSDAPEAGDDLATIGNKTDVSRQNAIIMSVYGEGSPSLIQYKGINDYSLSGKAKTIISPENNEFTGKFKFTSGEDVEDKFGQTDSQMNNLQGQLTSQQGQLNTQQGQITNIQTSIQAIPGQIKQEVSQTVTYEVGNLQIGMVNLLKGSNVELGAQENILGRYNFDRKPETGKIYTLVVCYTLGENNTEIYPYQDSGATAIISLKTKGEKIIESRTFTYKSTVGSSYMVFTQLPRGTYGSKVHWAVLVEGNKGPNAWIPSLSEQGQEAAKDAVDNLQIGAVNLVSRKMMLAWNEKNKDIAVWGQDSDGIYLAINQKLLYDNISSGSQKLDCFLGEGRYKANTQHVLQVEWKLASAQTDNGLSFFAVYTDGTSDGIRIDKAQTSLIKAGFITAKGKTVKKIYATYGVNTSKTQVYSLALYEGNKVLSEPPVATEDLTGQSNVNLVDGGKEVTVASDYYSTLKVPVLKPNTVYTVRFTNVEVISGDTPSGYEFRLYDTGLSANYSTVKIKAGDNHGILITSSNFTVPIEGRLLFYPGIQSEGIARSVKYTEIMLVEGFTSPSSYSPSPGDVQKEFDEINNRLGEWASDGYISPQEKTALRQQKSDIQSEQKDIVANANRYNISLTSYSTAYNSAMAALNKYTATSPENISVSSDYNNIAAYYTARQTILNSIAAAAKAQADKTTGAIGMDGGKMLYKDPEFKKGYNGISSYGAQNNGDNGRGTVVLNRISKSTGNTSSNSFTAAEAAKIKEKATGSPHNGSDWCLYIRAYGGTTTSHLGGFGFGNQSRANAVFIVKVSAKIPVGYTLKNAHNAHGDNYKQEFLTSMAGTGKYETYIFKETCGSTGTFSSVNWLYLSGPVKPESDPLEWFVDYVTVFDMTADGYGDIVDTVTTEFNTKIDQKADSVTVSAMRTDLNSLGQVVNQQGSQLQVNTNSIDAIVTKNGSGTIVSIKPEMVEITGSTVIKDGNGNKVNIFGVGDKVISVNGGVFSVDKVGKVIMTNAEITAKITSKSGEIGPFTIEGQWLRGSNLSLSGSQLNFSYSGHQVYVGSHPDMTTAGNAKLGTFMLSGGGYGGLGSNKQVALIAGAPNNGNSYAMAVTQGMLKMFSNAHIVSGVSRAYMTGTNPGITLGNEHPNIICLYGTGDRKKITLYSGMEIGSHFFITSEDSQGFDIHCYGSERFYRNGKAYLAIQSSGQDTVLVMKVDTYRWTACQLPVNWLGVWNP